MEPVSSCYFACYSLQSTETVNAKAKADEYEAQKAALEDHLKSLKVILKEKEL